MKFSTRRTSHRLWKFVVEVFLHFSTLFRCRFDVELTSKLSAGKDCFSGSYLIKMYCHKLQDAARTIAKYGTLHYAPILHPLVPMARHAFWLFVVVWSDTHHTQKRNTIMIIMSYLDILRGGNFLFRYNGLPNWVQRLYYNNNNNYYY